MGEVVTREPRRVCSSASARSSDRIGAAERKPGCISLCYGTGHGLSRASRAGNLNRVRKLSEGQREIREQAAPGEFVAAREGQATSLLSSKPNGYQRTSKPERSGSRPAADPSPAHLMGWSAAFTPATGIEAGTKEIISWNYTRWALTWVKPFFISWD